MTDLSFETFPPLTAVPWIRHAFSLRTTSDTKADGHQDRVLTELEFAPLHCGSAEQTHGSEVAVVTVPGHVPVVDALVTNVPDLPLVVRCADCAAVYVVDQRTRAIGLAHSGKRGTQANIVGNMLATMRTAFGTDPSDCLALVSPCIGPCHYEMDIWSAIESQLREVGVGAIHNRRICTACHLDRYFSYRAEKGQTGRMYALLARRR